MAAPDIEADAAAIKAFAKALTSPGTPLGLEPLLAKDALFSGWVQQLTPIDFRAGGGLLPFQAGKLDFGQGQPVLDQLMNGAASQMAQRYNVSLEGFAGNVEDYLTALTVLSEAAGTIQAHYQDASDAALADAGFIKQALDNAPTPQGS